MTRAQSCFLRKAFSSRWASPRLVTWKGTRGEAVSLFGDRRTTNRGFLEPRKDNGHLAKDPCPSPATRPGAKLNPVRDDSAGTGGPVCQLALPQDGCDHVKKIKQEQEGLWFRLCQACPAPGVSSCVSHRTPRGAGDGAPSHVRKLKQACVLQGVCVCACEAGPA